MLDLFAGTGSISYEFASRGRGASLRWRSTPSTTISSGKPPHSWESGNFYPVKANVFLYLKSCPKQFDIIFSDAPMIWKAANRS